MTLTPIELRGGNQAPVFTRHVNPKPILLTGARIIDPASNLDEVGGLLIEQGRVRDFGPHIMDPRFVHADRVIDLAGKIVIPGLVDTRVHIAEPGGEYRETIAETMGLAVRGGVTALCALPATNPVLDTVPNLQYAVRKAREAKQAKLYAMGAASIGLEGKALTEVGSLAQAGAVGLSNGNQAIAQPDMMMKIMSYAQAFGLKLHHFPFEPSLSKGSMNKGSIATQLGLQGSSTLAEVLMVQRDIELCRATGIDLHIGPLTCREALKLIRQAKSENVAITCSTAPQYFTLNEREVGDYRTYAKLNPPLRSESDRQAVVEAIADGTIDTICSDHCPQDMDSKRVPFEQAAFGMVGLETLLTLCLTRVHTGEVALKTMLSCLTDKPARLMGRNVGEIKRGNAADLCVLDLDSPIRVSGHKLAGRSKNSPFEGFPAQGKAVMTLVDGRILFDELTDHNENESWP